MCCGRKGEMRNESVEEWRGQTLGTESMEMIPITPPGSRTQATDTDVPGHHSSQPQIQS